MWWRSGRRWKGATLEEYIALFLAGARQTAPDLKETSRTEIDAPPGYLIESEGSIEGVAVIFKHMFTTKGDFAIVVQFTVVKGLSDLHQPVWDSMLSSLQTFSPAAPAGAITPTYEDSTGLIARDVLFRLSDKSAIRLSYDGTRISYRAPVCGELLCFMNVWVGPADHPTAAKPVTHDTDYGIRSYFWAYTDEHVLYTQDTDGDENWRIYAVDLTTG